MDHEWTLNSTNWAYNSGVGSDPRDRVFRTVLQGQRCVWGWVGRWGVHLQPCSPATPAAQPCFLHLHCPLLNCCSHQSCCPCKPLHKSVQVRP